MSAPDSRLQTTEGESAQQRRATIAILDYGSQYTQLIARRVRESRVYIAESGGLFEGLSDQHARVLGKLRRGLLAERMGDVGNAQLRQGSAWPRSAHRPRRGARALP